jgi:hypothetical protein
MEAAMTQHDKTEVYRSTQWGRLAVRIAWAQCILIVIFGFVRFATVLAPPDIAQTINYVAGYGSIYYCFSGLMTVAGWLITVRWLWHLHIDLAELYPPYPISSDGALVRYLVPVAHYYGMWSIFKTLARTLLNDGLEPDPYINRLRF